MAQHRLVQHAESGIWLVKGLENDSFPVSRSTWQSVTKGMIIAPSVSRGVTSHGAARLDGIVATMRAQASARSA
jgi:hypothetical protein